MSVRLESLSGRTRHILVMMRQVVRWWLHHLVKGSFTDKTNVLASVVFGKVARSRRALADTRTALKISTDLGSSPRGGVMPVRPKGYFGTSFGYTAVKLVHYVLMWASTNHNDHIITAVVERVLLLTVVNRAASGRTLLSV